MGILSQITAWSKRSTPDDDYSGGTRDMNALSRLRSSLSSSFRAKWYYVRGMRRARLHKHQAAIDDYTVVIEMVEAPGSLRAEALYNRALVYNAADRESDAISDLNRVMEMVETAERVMTEARRQLVRMKRTHDREDDSSARRHSE